MSTEAYWVPVAPPAMGVAKKHMYRDCRCIKKAAVREIPASNLVHRYLAPCQVCAERAKRVLAVLDAAKS